MSSMKGKTKRSPSRAIFTGGFTGASMVAFTYPTEYVKTYLQLYDQKGRMSPLECGKQTVSRYGFFGLYRGMTSLVYFSIPKVATRFFAYESLKQRFVDANGRMTPMQTVLCGLGAGVAEAIVAVTPMDTIKTKLIHDQLSAESKYRGFFHGCKEIIKEKGISGTYKGLTATIMKQGSNQAIRWLTFTQTKQWLAGPGVNPDKLPIYYTMAASVIAGAASVFGNAPVDVIKTRMQGLQADKYKGVLDCAKQIYTNEGMRGFYKGSSARLARVCLDVMMLMTIYEQLNKFIDRLLDDK